MSKLIDDIINNSATGNFRFKDDFDNYILNLDNKFKTQVSESETTTPIKLPDNSQLTITGVILDTEDNKNVPPEKSEKINKNAPVEKLPAVGEPRAIPRKHVLGKAALRLGKNYTTDDCNCLNEKGKQMLLELESLNIQEYPFATAALCRALLECVIKLWIDAENGPRFNSGTLSATYNSCLTFLRSKKIVDDKEHKVLTAQINKEHFIDLLNTWIHSDTSACVSETNLVSGWKNTRLLVEKYIDKHRK